MYLNHMAVRELIEIEITISLLISAQHSSFNFFISLIYDIKVMSV